ncbi:hypothetical protein HFO56_39340 [Rhizobium laguerreae]|uniref:hypothetical protein n=1 Tax=Rhizobium laguerreae TaxID=1076926 RepID=UPI001C914C0E|nr:hypothetical protein [Rhizobium laguerreae]MBY3158356.1 hypothetical protein [Rhizobium laguerreae]
MIENKHQLAVTRKQAQRFKEAIAGKKAAERPEDVAPVIWRAMIDGMESMLETLTREIAEFEAKPRVGQSSRSRA